MSTIESIQALVQDALHLSADVRSSWLAGQLHVGDAEALRLLAGHFSLTPFEREELSAFQADLELAGFADCQRRGCVLGSLGKDAAGSQSDHPDLVFICQDPFDLDAQLWFESLIEQRRPLRLVRGLASHQDMAWLFAEIERDIRAMDTVDVQGPVDNEPQDGFVLLLSMASIEASSNSTVRLVDSILYDALKLGASDIHFEVQQRALQVKYRLDGVLQAVKKIDSLDSAHQAVSRLKVLADLDIAERRIPQDGRFRVILDQREIDFRVSIMPNMIGEDAVLRILDRKHLTGQFQSLTLDSLSFDADVKAFVRRASRLPYGLLLVTGPTGSGKTTTLYAAISEINTGLDKIITIEDPIEYQLAGVLQIPVNEKKGLTFAKGLRSVLRHDPDKIMVGEIRDSDTAQISVQAALTGHQVFTTIHANNVFDVIGRFANMGVDTYSLVAALTGIMAQRLVRTLCQHCAIPSEPSDMHSLLRDEEIDEHTRGAHRFKSATGCPQCRGTGYRGRAAIAETLHIDDEIKDLLVQRPSISAIKRLAREKGFRSLRQSAVLLALRGVTTMDEVNRVAPAEQRT